MKTKLILGGPGSGKTTRLLEVMERELENGCGPKEIAFVSFTVKATTEARQRAAKKFGVKEDEFDFMRTIHSMAFRMLHLSMNMTMKDDDWKAIGKRLGVNVTGEKVSLAVLEDEDDSRIAEGDVLIALDGLARTTFRPLDDVWRERDPTVPFQLLKDWVATSDDYRRRLGKVDYTDMLEMYLKKGRPVPVKVAIIDEAQDLTPLQWKVVRKMFEKTERIFIAGDDDQAIFDFAGADTEEFLDLKHDEREVLPVSHRLPTDLFALAANFVHQHVENRYEKDWSAKEGNERGKIEVVTLNHVEDDIFTSDETWLLLARNSCFLKDMAKWLRELGLPFTYRGKPSVFPDDMKAIKAYGKWARGDRLKQTEAKAMMAKTSHPNRLVTIAPSNPPPWSDVLTKIYPNYRRYYRKLIERYGTLDVKPNAHINTIHGVKGGEADHVVLRTDVTKKTSDGADSDRGRDSEARVFYVGITRAKRSLRIVLPEGEYSYGPLVRMM